MRQFQTGDQVLISFDYALRRLLRNKVNYDVVEGFLSELLREHIKVKSIGESQGYQESYRYNGVDILAEDETGEMVLIELQFMLGLDFIHRKLHGTNKEMIIERIALVPEYKAVNKAYSINILYFEVGEGKDYVYYSNIHFVGQHKNDELCLSKAQRVLMGKEATGGIYFESYILMINKFNDIINDSLDEWIYYLKHNTVKDEFHAKGLDKAREVLDRDKLTREEQKDYEAVLWNRSKDLSDYYSAVDTGKTEGRIEREKLAKELEKREKELEKRKKEREEHEKEREEYEKEREQLLAEIARLKQNK
jgi:hypothetical protein